MITAGGHQIAAGLPIPKLTREIDGVAPHLGGHIEALKVIMEAIKNSSYKPKTDILIALDPASIEIIGYFLQSFS